MRGLSAGQEENEVELHFPNRRLRDMGVPEVDGVKGASKQADVLCLGGHHALTPHGFCLCAFGELGGGAAIPDDTCRSDKYDEDK